MVVLAMLPGCDGCGGDGITILSLGDASFDVFGDGGLDGLLPDGGIAGAAGATSGTAGASAGVTGGSSSAVAGSGSGTAGVGAAAGSGAAASGGSGIGGSWAGRGGTGGSAGRPWTGGSGGNDAGVRCDIYSTCWYPDGTICDQFGFCCSIDDSGRCCDGESCKPEPTWNSPPVPSTVDEPWQPPLPAEDIGVPGWRNSTETFCTERLGNTYAHSVWSDSRGVFVAAINDGSVSTSTTCPWCISEQIYFNDGTGWTLVPGAVSGDGDDLQVGGQLTLTGFDNGPLVLYGYGTYQPMTGEPCSLALLDGGERFCEPVDGVSDVHVVSSTLAYGMLNGNSIRYDGERWGPVPAAAPSQGVLNMIWANDAVVMATGGQTPGTIYTLRGGTWYVENTRTLEYFTAIWGFAANDVWAGTQQGGLYHYDGTNWTEVAWPGSGCNNFSSEIGGMWGSGGTVYWITTNAIGRWNGTQAETIAQWPCDSGEVSARLTSVWGNSPTEVFFSVVDERRPLNECGSAFVMHYDGTQFHPM